MKKVLLLTMTLLPLLACAGNSQTTDTELKSNYSKIAADLKSLSPECRKVYLVATSLMSAYDNINENNYYSGITFLCMAYFYHDMNNPEIALLSESSGDYLYAHEQASFLACTDVLKAKGDAAWDFYQSKTTQATLQNYVKKHSDKCSQQRGK